MAKDRGAGLGSRRVQGRWGAGERAGAHRCARRGRWAQQAGVQGARQAGRQACVDARASAGARGRAAGARASGRRASCRRGARGQHGRAGAGRTWARGAGGNGSQGALHRRGRRAAWELGARPGRLG